MADAQTEQQQKNQDQNDKTDTPESGGASQPASDKDLVSLAAATRLGIALLLLAILLAYILVASWPVPNSTGYAEFSLFGCRWTNVSVDTRLMFTVMLAGAIGSLIHVLTSFADYAANRQLRWSWVLWFALRLPIGMALALALYLVVRAGLIPPPSGGSGTPAPPANGPAYGYAATSVLVGMFAKQAGDKLKEIFDTLFTPKNPVNRADALTAAKLAITGTEPKTLTIGDDKTPLTINGRGFASTTTATINGKPRTVTFASETQIKVALDSGDVKDEGKLAVVVQNPAPAAATANVTVVVGPAPAVGAAKPGINQTKPKMLVVNDPKPLTVIGQGFSDACKATINDKDRDTARTSDTEIQVTVLADDVANAGTLQLVVRNTAPDGLKSDAFPVDVTEAAAAKPVIAKTAPDLTKGMTPPLTVSGTGFQENCTATINDEDRAAQWVSATEVTVTVTEADVATAATLKLVVTNPGPDSLGSDPFDLVVTP